MGESEDPRDDQEIAPEDQGDSFKWLDDLADGPGSIWDESLSGDNEATDELLQESASEEIPEWLKVDLEQDLVADENVPEWLVPDIDADDSSREIDRNAPEQIGTTQDETAGGIEVTADSDETFLFQPEESPAEDEAAGAMGEEEPHWLEQMAAGEGAAIEEPPTTSLQDDEQAESKLPEEFEGDSLTWVDDFETVPELELIADDDAQMMAGVPDEFAISDDQRQATTEEKVVGDEEVLPTEVPEDPDEAMAWLESLAANQGAPIEELPSMQEAEELSPEQKDVPPADDVVDGDVMPSMESVPGDLLVAEVSEDLSADVEEGPDAFDIEDTLVYGLSGFTSMDNIAQPDGVPVTNANSVTSEIPEDPDEAMIWIEQLAARQASQLDEQSSEEEVKAVRTDEPQVESELDDVPEGVGSEVDEFNLSGDLDEALSWLEEAVDFEAGDPADPVEIVEEPPTPHVVHDVALVLEEVSSLKAEEAQEGLEPPVLEVVEEEAEAIDETAEAFAWLDHLAEAGSELPDDLITPEPSDLPAPESVGEVVEMPTLESQEPTFESLEDPIPVQEIEDDIDKDMAWLDTLGAVRAEEWLAAEEEVPIEELEALPVSQESVGDVGMVPELAIATEEIAELELDAQVADDEVLEKMLSEAKQTQLGTARSAFEAGQVNQALEQYESLLGDDSSIPFVISDLEASLGRHGDQLLVQRTLGDAYARNGQLNKALEIYRQALDIL